MPSDIEKGVGVYDIIYTHGQPNEQQNVCVNSLNTSLLATQPSAAFKLYLTDNVE